MWFCLPFFHQHVMLVKSSGFLSGKIPFLFSSEQSVRQPSPLDSNKTNIDSWSNLPPSFVSFILTDFVKGWAMKLSRAEECPVSDLSPLEVREAIYQGRSQVPVRGEHAPKPPTPPHLLSSPLATHISDGSWAGRRRIFRYLVFILVFLILLIFEHAGVVCEHAGCILIVWCWTFTPWYARGHCETLASWTYRIHRLNLPLPFFSVSSFFCTLIVEREKT